MSLCLCWDMKACPKEQGGRSPLSLREGQMLLLKKSSEQGQCQQELAPGTVPSTALLPWFQAQLAQSCLLPSTWGKSSLLLSPL
jgi:hypothetical protein